MRSGEHTRPLGCLLYTSFNYGEGMEYLWYEDAGRLTEDDEPDPSEDEVPDWNGRLDGDPDSYWSWDSDLCQRNVSEFNGIWYYDGDLSAETYIVIDGNGNWSYYQRAPGAEPAEMDCGVFTYSMDEVDVYKRQAEKAYKTALRKLKKDLYGGAYGRWLSAQKSIRAAKAEAEQAAGHDTTPQRTWLDEKVLAERFICEVVSLIRVHEIFSDALENETE